jgi:prolipoprotein diacylglyceryl transferase
LASFPSPAQGVWYLGPVPIRAYAVCIIVGIIVALVIGDRRWVARGGERGVVYDIALWAVPFGLIGGRLYHLMTDWRTYFGDGGAGPVAALRVWDGGLGIWGAVALGGVGAWIGCRRRGIPLPAFGDAIAPGIVLAQAIGRLGNYFNQELYGRETTLPWGMEIFYRRDPSGIIDAHSLNGVSTGQIAAIVHPTFLYELIWNVLVFVVLIIVDRRFKVGHGRLFALYVALYCVGRFGVELLRDDTATHIAGIRINLFTATFVFLGAVVYMILARKGREDPSALRGRIVTEDEEKLAPELAEELVAVAGATGVVAAATVAGREDIDDGEFESVGESAGSIVDVATTDEATEPTQGADEVDEVAGEHDIEAAADDEAIVEAEAAAFGVETETVDDDPDQLIDDDHDPLDGVDLEGQPEVTADHGPLSQQAEEFDDTEDVDEDDAMEFDDTEDVDEGDATKAVADDDEPEDEDDEAEAVSESGGMPEESEPSIEEETPDGVDLEGQPEVTADQGTASEPAEAFDDTEDVDDEETTDLDDATDSEVAETAGDDEAPETEDDGIEETVESGDVEASIGEESPDSTTVDQSSDEPVDGIDDEFTDNEADAFDDTGEAVEADAIDDTGEAVEADAEFDDNEEAADSEGVGESGADITTEEHTDGAYLSFPESGTAVTADSERGSFFGRLFRRRR